MDYTTIIIKNLDDYLKYEKEVVEMFFDAFTNNPPIYIQHMDLEKETASLREIAEKGFFIIAKDNNDKVLGFAGSYELINDGLLPDSVKNKFDIDRCYYLAEMAVQKDHRGKGIGSRLVKESLENIDKNKYDKIFVRNKVINSRAGQLYERLGFKPDEIVKQSKIKKDQSGNFIVEKQYMWKNLKDQ